MNRTVFHNDLHVVDLRGKKVFFAVIALFTECPEVLEIVRPAPCLWDLVINLELDSVGGDAPSAHLTPTSGCVKHRRSQPPIDSSPANGLCSLFTQAIPWITAIWDNDDVIPLPHITTPAIKLALLMRREAKLLANLT